MIVAHSLGGFLMLKAVAQNPDTTGQLILVGRPTIKSAGQV
jgi:predicted alpha/beta hydrolase family esterase